MKTATKERHEVEEEQHSENVHRAPKHLPPRFDRRNRSIEEYDPDLDERDEDLSMNYKDAAYQGSPGYLPMDDPQRPYHRQWSRKDIRDLTDQDFSAIISAARGAIDLEMYNFIPDVAYRNALDYAIWDLGNGLYDHLIDAPTYNYLLAAMGELAEVTATSSPEVAEGRSHTSFIGSEKAIGATTENAPHRLPASEAEVKKMSAQEVKNFTTHLDRLASTFQKNWKALGLPERYAMSCAYRLDAVSDHMEKAALQHRVADVEEGDPDEPYMPEAYDEAGVIDGQGDSDEPYMAQFDDMPGMPANENGEAVRGRSEPVELKDQAESNPWADAPSQQPSQNNVVDKADSRTYVSSYQPVTKAGAELHKKLFS